MKIHHKHNKMYDLIKRKGVQLTYNVLSERCFALKVMRENDRSSKRNKQTFSPMSS